MKAKNIILIIGAVCMANIISMRAQLRARTIHGDEVLLYEDGTWEYADIYDDNVLVEDNGSGKSAKIVIDNDLMITLENGRLTGFSVLREGIRLYDNFSGKLKKAGPYKIEYEFSSDRLAQVGPYKIEYEFSTGRVKKIGKYSIEYDFHTDKISQIGNTRFEYSFFNGKLSEIRGSTPGLWVSIF